jgi:hypothetical protein
MISASLFAVFAAIGLTAFADDPAPQLQSFTYRVVVPAGTASCADHAQALATRFGAASGAQSVSGSCESRSAIDPNDAKSPEIDTIIVSYQDYQMDTPTRTIFSTDAFLGTHYAGDGAFTSYTECLAQLAPQDKLFTQQTGLQVVDSYCQAPTETDSGYLLTIESFGVAKAYLSVYAVGQQEMGGASQLISAAKNAIAKAGGVVAWSNDVFVFYYTTNDASIETRDLGDFANDTDCESQTGDAVKIYTAGGLTGASAFCANNVLTLVAAGADGVYDDFGYNSDKYSTFSDCMNDKTRVLANLTSTGASPLGVLCEDNIEDDNMDGSYVMHIFYQNN